MEDKKIVMSDIFSTIAKRFWIIVLAAIVGAGAAFFLRPSEKTVQTATSQIMISPNKQFDISNGTLSDLVRSDRVLGKSVREFNKSVKKGNQKAEYSLLFSKLDVTVNGNSRIVTITAGEDTSGEPKKLIHLIAKNLKRVADAELPTYKSAIVTDAVVVEDLAKGISVKKAVVLGAAVGVIIGVALAYLIEYFVAKSRKN